MLSSKTKELQGCRYVCSEKHAEPHHGSGHDNGFEIGKSLTLPADITPRWLKLKEAALYASIGKTRLKELAVQGIVKGFPDPDSRRGDWIFDRHSLDAYREGQAGHLHQKAIDLLKRHRI